MHAEKGWVVSVFAAIAAAIVVVFGINAYRDTARYTTSHGTGVDATRSDSLKALAAAVRNPETRHEVVASLTAREGDLAIDLLGALAFKSTDPEVRAAALAGLGEIGDLRGLQVMTIGARDEDVGVRIAAVTALCKLTNDTALAVVADVVGNDVDAGARTAAAGLLGDTRGSSVTADILIRRLQDEEVAATRGLVARALGRLRDGNARQALVATLNPAGEVEPTVRLQALRALDAIPDDYRVKGVACALGDSDGDVRAEATRIFAALGDEALPALSRALRSSELRRVIKGAGGEAVHADILRTVAAMHVPEASEALYLLLDLAVEDGDKEKPRVTVREGAIAALAELGAPAVEPIAQNVLAPAVRWPLKLAAARVLTAVGTPAVAALSTYAASRVALTSSAEAKLWIETLEAIGGDQAPAAIEVVRSHDPDVVFGALAAAGQSVSGQTRPPAPQLAEYRLVLYGGIYGGNPPSAYAKRKDSLPFVKRDTTDEAPPPTYAPHFRPNVVLDLARTARGWDRAYVHQLGFNNGTSFGQVIKADVTDASFEMAFRVAVGRDPYLVGGYGEYTASLTRTADGRYQGTYEGRYHDLPISGVAVCTKAPARPPLRQGFRPVMPNEHPRMLFRRFDIPALRAKLNTPLGKAAFQRMAGSGNHVALGVLYQVTGDPRYALSAIPSVRREMADRDFGFRGLGQVWGPRWSDIAMAYDLCYDAWPEAFREEVASYARNGSFAGTTQMQKFSNCANNHPCSNYFSPICGGAAMLALTYWMDPGMKPQPPGGAELLTPPRLLGQPPASVPLVPLVPNQPPASWIWSGPVFAQPIPEELLAAIGETAANPIKVGRAFTFGGATYTFGAIEQRYLSGSSVYPWSALCDEVADFNGAGMVLHTIVENHRPGFYRVVLPPQGDAVCMINGLPVADKSIVELGEGLYPIVLAYVGLKDMLAGVAVTFQFVTSNAEEIKATMADAAEQMRRERVLYDLAMADYAVTGMDEHKDTTFHCSAVNMFRSHRILMGDGGYQSEGEGYTFTAITPLRYAAACMNVFGQTLTPYPDVTHFPVRYIATSALYPSGRDGSGRSLVSYGFNGGGGGTHGITFIAAGFPVIPDKYKPAVLWVWNKLKGVDEDNPSTLANLVAGNDDITDTINTFVNYPLDMKPVHPRERIPNTWKATTKGVYVFRNGWEDQNDIILMANAYELVTMGNSGPDVGGLRLMGLGHGWTYGGGGKKSAAWMNNIPLLIEDGRLLSGSGPGRVVSYTGEENGSGSVSINMDLVYGPRKGGGHDRGGIWPLEPPPPGEISGLRAVAADYSGKCGAPALIVIVDKIVGGPERRWVWHLPDNRGKRPPVAASANTFTITQGDASLHATFVSPGGARVQAPGYVDLTPTAVELHKRLAYMKKEERDNYEVSAESTAVDIMATAPPGESFFTLMTLQRGTPPPVKIVQGSGLDAVVQVGEQRVRFDGTRVIIGSDTND